MAGLRTWALERLRIGNRLYLLMRERLLRKGHVINLFSFLSDPLRLTSSQSKKVRRSRLNRK